MTVGTWWFVDDGGDHNNDYSGGGDNGDVGGGGGDGHHGGEEHHGAAANQLSHWGSHVPEMAVGRYKDEFKYLFFRLDCSLTKRTTCALV